jgi:hypothetical protein
MPSTISRIFMLKEFFVAFWILAICVVIHTSALVSFGQFLAGHASILEKRFSAVYSALLLNVIFALVTVLHLTEAGIWAAFYYVRGLFTDYETAFYFSLGTYSTIGYGDVVLPEHWRLLGGIEGVSGVLLCGLSAAFIFAVINVMFQMRQQLKKERG